MCSYVCTYVRTVGTYAQSGISITQKVYLTTCVCTYVCTVCTYAPTWIVTFTDGSEPYCIYSLMCVRMCFYTLQIKFDPYQPSTRGEWRTVMDRFKRDVRVIEEEANSFINDSFESLRSAEGAFDMLHNFKHIRARESINETMMRKFDQILDQYGKEVCTYVCCMHVRICVCT